MPLYYPYPFSIPETALHPGKFGFLFVHCACEESRNHTTVIRLLYTPGAQYYSAPPRRSGHDTRRYIMSGFE